MTTPTQTPSIVATAPIRCFGVALAVALALSFCQPAFGDTLARSTATSAGSLRLRLGYAELRGTPGAFSPHAVVVVHREPSAFGSASAGIYAFTIKRGHLRHPISLRLPLAKPLQPRSITAIAYLGSGGTWHVARAHVDADGKVATARVKHLSTWTELDVEGYMVQRLQEALGPHAFSSAASCNHPDTQVNVLGNGPLGVCITSTEVTLTNPTGTAFTIINCTGGLNNECISVGDLRTLSGVIGAHGGEYSISYNSSAPVSTLKYTPNLASTLETGLVPTLLRLLGDDVALAIQLVPCIEKAAPTSFVSGVAVAIGCILQSGVGLTFGPLDLGKLGRDLAERLLTNAADKAIQGQTLAPGGIITLTTKLPVVGPPGPGPRPPTTPPEPTPPPVSAPDYVYFVYGTCADGACGLHERSGPGYSNYPSVGSLPEGAELDIVCQESGETVGPSPATGNSSAIWDRLTNGAWVSDLYTTTPGVGTWSPPIPRC